MSQHQPGVLYGPASAGGSIKVVRSEIHSFKVSVIQVILLVCPMDTSILPAFLIIHLMKEMGKYPGRQQIACIDEGLLACTSWRIEVAPIPHTVVRLPPHIY